MLESKVDPALKMLRIQLVPLNLPASVFRIAGVQVETVRSGDQTTIACVRARPLQHILQWRVSTKIGMEFLAYSMHFLSSQICSLHVA